MDMYTALPIPEVVNFSSLKYPGVYGHTRYPGPPIRRVGPPPKNGGSTTVTVTLLIFSVYYNKYEKEDVMIKD